MKSLKIIILEKGMQLELTGNISNYEILGIIELLRVKVVCDALEKKPKELQQIDQSTHIMD